MCHQQDESDIPRECDIAALNGPPLKLILKHACSKQPAQELHNILSASKALRSAVLEHATGKTELTYTSAQTLEEVEALAAWLATHGHLLGFLDFSPRLVPPFRVCRALCTQEEQVAAEKAVASALRKAASAVAHRGGLQLQACKLTRATPQVADLLMQLSPHCLTRLELKILVPHSGSDWSLVLVPSPNIPYIWVTGLSNCLQHLTSLRELSLNADFEAFSNPLSLDPLLEQLSVLTRLTALTLGKVLLTDSLRHLPASLKFLSIDFDIQVKPLDLRHLTALTRLENQKHTHVAGNYILAPNLLELSVGDVSDVDCEMSLNQLKVLSLRHLNVVHPVPEYLQQLSRLTNLDSIDLRYQCTDAGVTDEAAYAWQFLPINHIHLEPQYSDISRFTISQLGTLTKLTGLTLLLNGDCTCETLTFFPRALCKLTQLKKLLLAGVRDWQDPGKASASQLDPIFDAMGQLEQLEDLCIGRMPISHTASRHLAESLAGQLTRLALRSNSVDDSDVNALILASPRLVNLSLAGSPLTDDLLPVIASTCTGLTHLFCSFGTEMTNEGVKQYLPDLYHSMRWQQKSLPELVKNLCA